MATDFGLIEGLVVRGHYSDAYRALNHSASELKAAALFRYFVLYSEASLAIGEIDVAGQLATQVIEGRGGTVHERISAYRTLAIVAYYHGDTSRLIEHLTAARSLCSGLGYRWLAEIELTATDLLSGLKPIEVSLSGLPSLRQTVLRAGDPHLLAWLRLGVARLEGRRNCVAEARRHIEIAASLLESFPNLWLEGRMLLNRGVLSLLVGDLEASVADVTKALEVSEKSGHLRTRIAASINLSHLMERKGDLRAARHHVDYAFHHGAGNRHLLRAAYDSLANVLITSGNYDECRVVLAQAARLAIVREEAKPHWDAITELYSQSRLAQAEARWKDSEGSLEKALRIARSAGDRWWQARIHLARATSLAKLGNTAAATSEVAAAVHDEPTPDVIAHGYGSRAVVESALARFERSAQDLGRALRVAGAMSNASLVQELTASVVGPGDLTGGRAADADKGPRADLDSAVVLLDLAGYPHILAREAYAILQESGSVEAVALVAIGKTGTRVIEAEGWSERQAVEAAGAPAVEKMAAGTHRDELWQVLARPRDGLDHHCTVVAVRKLVAAAAALDRYRRDEKQRAALWPAEALENDPDSVWASEQTAEILGIARRIAPTPLSVLLTGETGTGKEMLARAIHRASDRAEKPFLPFNCTAVPRDMLESQLFGYRRGAFTGADASFAGIIRSAAGGTLFLDEIAEVGPELQPKLLRFLETHEIHPLGEPQPIKVDVRVIAATNRDMEQLVADGRFREDLFYRLNVIRLKLPPLRERREEIPPLVQHYLRRYSDEQKKGTLRLADETLEYLLLYSWPGNVRQLANEVRRMVALAERDATLTPAELSPEIQASRKTIAVPAGDEPEIRVRLEQPLPAAVELLEKTMVRHALTRANGRVEEASRLLGISRKGLFLKRKRWGLRHAS